jgi:hypothetical protein
MRTSQLCTQILGTGGTIHSIIKLRKTVTSFSSGSRHQVKSKEVLLVLVEEEQEAVRGEAASDITRFDAP